MTFLAKDRVEVITGVNLPMLIKLADLRTSADLLGSRTRCGITAATPSGSLPT